MSLLLALKAAAFAGCVTPSLSVFGKEEAGAFRSYD